MDETLKMENFIRDQWGDSVIDVIRSSEHLSMDFNSFLDHCTACGGNWVGMLLSGLRELCPAVYDAIPDDMGKHAWTCICNTIQLLGVDCSEG